MQTYLPEGFRPESPISLSILEKARYTGQILEAKAIICDNSHNLIVDCGDTEGLIPREEAAMGIREGVVKDIAVLSRVNKTVCFKVLDILRNGSTPCPILSRVQAQEEALDQMLETYREGDILDGRITHMEPFGAFVDIGCGVVGLLNIENISVSRIAHPKDRFVQGQHIKVIVKDIDRNMRRFTLSHKELLGTWQQNADLFRVGQTVCGTVRSVEDYGIFVELTPNLAGLAEQKDLVFPGQQATVYIKNIIPDKMKIKLSIIDSFDGAKTHRPCTYFAESDHMDCFRYSPPTAWKQIETVFSD